MPVLVDNFALQSTATDAVGALSSVGSAALNPSGFPGILRDRCVIFAANDIDSEVIRTMLASLSDQELKLTEAARQKMGELFEDIDDDIAGVRVYSAAGGCSGVSFGMTFTDAINDNDGVREYESYKVVVDDDTLEHIRGVEIDFVDRGDGNATFVFNNLPTTGGGCGSCGSSSSSGGGCS